MDQLVEFSEAFDHFDADHSGAISMAEFARVVRALGEDLDAAAIGTHRESRERGRGSLLRRVLSACTQRRSSSRPTPIAAA